MTAVRDPYCTGGTDHTCRRRDGALLTGDNGDCWSQARAESLEHHARAIPTVLDGRTVAWQPACGCGWSYDNPYPIRAEALVVADELHCDRYCPATGRAHVWEADSWDGGSMVRCVECGADRPYQEVGS